MLNGRRIVVVLPAFNAVRTVEAILRELPEVVDECILVDDASSDDTVDLAHRLNLIVVGHEKNQAYDANQKTC